MTACFSEPDFLGMPGWSWCIVYKVSKVLFYLVFNFPTSEKRRHRLVFCFYLSAPFPCLQRRIFGEDIILHLNFVTSPMRSSVVRSLCATLHSWANFWKRRFGNKKAKNYGNPQLWLDVSFVIVLWKKAPLHRHFLSLRFLKLFFIIIYLKKTFTDVTSFTAWR